VTEHVLTCILLVYNGQRFLSFMCGS